MAKPEKEKSVGWVAALLALAVAYAGWAFMAADYFQHADSSARGKIDFFPNSIEQLSNMGSVLGHAFQNRIWLVALIGVLELGVLVLFVVMKKLEKEFSR